MRGRPLQVLIEDGEIVIRIGIDTLQMAVRACPELENYDSETASFHEPVVVDPEVFASEVFYELTREAEDGTTLVHDMFDNAFLCAIEQGAEGIRMPGDET